MAVTEILTKAILNTILGMGTVFAVLMFIAFVISLLKYLPGLVETFKKKKHKGSASGVPVSETLLNGPACDEGGIMAAVITAALTSSMTEKETSGDDYIVRTIRRV